jgi:hypothetical protein
MGKSKNMMWGHFRKQNVCSFTSENEMLTKSETVGILFSKVPHIVSGPLTTLRISLDTFMLKLRLEDEAVT